MSWIRPIPQMAPENTPFYEGLKAGQFLVPKCQSCGNYNWTPYPACRTCQSLDQKWVEVSGKGQLYTYTMIHKGPKTFMDEGPYVEAFMKLDEEPRALLVHGNLVGIEEKDITLGMRLKISYFTIPGYDIPFYRFEKDND